MAARGKARVKPKRKMTRTGGGKQKGSAFERDICKRLSLWVSGGVDQDLFWRSAMSGGRATLARKKGVTLNRQAGDICAVAPEGHALTNKFYLECKHYKDLQVGSFMLQDIGLLAKFWRETRAHAKPYGKLPLLIAKQNFVPVMLVTDVHSLKGWPKPRATAVCGAAVWLFDDVVWGTLSSKELEDAEDTDNG